MLVKDFSRISTLIEATWGSPECLSYIQDLKTTTRIGREGFPLETLLRFDELMDQHAKEFPNMRDPRTLDIWAGR